MRSGQHWLPPRVTTSLGTSGPVRVVSDQHDESVELRPVGFAGITAALVRGEVRPPVRVRVWLGKWSGWWRWTCPACPQHIGGFCPDWRTALAAALAHTAGHA